MLHMLQELLLIFTSVLFIVDPFAAVSYVTLSAASIVERRLGATRMRILTRLMGLVLCAIAAKFIIDGIRLSLAPKP
jgi:small neutral amino acid transporter SnatA (MarC family)